DAELLVAHARTALQLRGRATRGGLRRLHRSRIELHRRLAEERRDVLHRISAGTGSRRRQRTLAPRLLLRWRRIRAPAADADELLGLFRNLREKWRRALIAETPVQAPLVRVEAVQLLARARHADVAEATLLFDVLILLERVGVRQDAFLHAGEKDDFELEPLRCMERHQRDAFLRLVAVEIGDQRDRVEIVGDRAALVLLPEFARGVEQ